MMAYKGPDISSWQGNIDIKTLAKQVDFFIFRAYAGVNKDKKVDRNVQLTIENGKPYGLYIYSYALNVAQAKEEAKKMIDLANSYSVKPTFLCIDMEDADGYKSRYGMPSNQTLQDICSIECDEFEKAGYYAMIYASSSWFNSKLVGLNRYDKWVAHWPVSGGKQKGNTVDPSGENANRCGIWQFTSEGILNGYNGRLDMNYAYKDFVVSSKTNSISTPQPTSYTYEDFVGEVQECIGAKVDRKAGPETLSKTPTISRYKNKNHPVVRPVQKYLYSLGYTEVGVADCDAGQKFEKAMKHYQKDHGCVVDGEATARDKTWKKLLKLA